MGLILFSIIPIVFCNKEVILLTILVYYDYFILVHSIYYSDTKNTVLFYLEYLALFLSHFFCM